MSHTEHNSSDNSSFLFNVGADFLNFLSFYDFFIIFQVQQMLRFNNRTNSLFPYWKYFVFKAINNFLFSFKNSLCVFKSQCCLLFPCVYWFRRFLKFINLIFQVYLFFKCIIQCNETAINFSFQKILLFQTFRNHMFDPFLYYLFCESDHLH